MERLTTHLPVVAVLVALLTIGRASLHAQDVHQVHGTVTDITGGVLVGAEVELTGAEGTETTRTDLQGRYEFNNVPPGDYVLLARYPGFEPKAAPHQLGAGGGTSTVNLSLAIAVTTSEVDVAAIGSEMLPSPFSHILSGDVLEQLPSSRGALRRRLQELAGATGRPGDVAIYVDGFRQVTRMPPRDAIQMIRISANPFAAEFFEPGHTRVEIVTKAGFQKPSGELTLNANDSVLNARHPLAPERADVRMRNVSGYLSTPVIPKHWSLVLYGGRWEEDASDVVNALVLDPLTGAPTPFNEAVVVPSLIDNGFLSSHHQLGGSHSLTVAVGHTRDVARNQGLEDGLDLPERAYARTEQEDLVRVSLTSAFGSDLFNEFRMEVKRIDASSESLVDRPAVSVLDAFNAGGNQDNLYRLGREDTLFLANHVTLARGRTTYKIGASADVLGQRDVDRTGFGGTFTFGSDVERDEFGNPIGESPEVVSPLEVYRRTLQGIPGYGPSQLAVVRGDPEVRFTQWWADWFVQADWTPSPAFTVSYGVRHDLQAHVPIVDGLNPRIGLAWSAGEDGRDVIRFGAGTFTERVPSRVTLDSHRLDGVTRQWFVLSDPAFFPEIPDDALADAVARTRATQVIDPDLRAPRLLRTSLTYERRLPASLSLSVGYAWERGTNLLRTRNVNAPIDGVRPQPDRGAVLQYESTGRSERHEGVIALRSDWTRRLTAFVNYTWAESRSDTDGPTTRPADSYDLGAEYSWHGEDVRHQGTAGFTLRLPRQWIVSLFAIAKSGRPFNITTGRDDNRDTLFGDRPAFASPDDPDAIVTPYGIFDPNPEPGDLRVPRNYGRDPAEVRVDLHVQKAISVGLGSTRIRLGADIVNLLNKANRTRTNGVLTAPSFGTARRALDARKVELFMGVSF